MAVCLWLQNIWHKGAFEMTRPIVLKTLNRLIFKGLKKRDQTGEAFYALGQLIGMFRQSEKKLYASEKSLAKFKRLRQAHLNLINKLKNEIIVLEKEIDFLKEQRNPTPECYTESKPKYDSQSFEENDFAQAFQTGGFCIPRF